MRISDIFSSSSFERTEKSDEARRHEDQTSSSQRYSYTAGEDTVTISPMSRQLAQVAGVLSDDEANTTQKVAALKDRIANGEYSVDSATLASAVVKYWGEGA